MSNDPKVKATPDFKKGETVIHKDSKEELKILEVTKEGNLRCDGIAALLPPTAVEKKL